MALLIWSDGTGRAGTTTLMLDIDQKPNLPFAFDALYYEPDTGMTIKTKTGKQYGLTRGEQRLCASLAEQIVDEADYLVHAFAEDLVFAGPMLKSEALKQGLSWCFYAPEHPASKCINDKWVRVVAVIMDNGILKEMPEGVCQLCVLHFTDAEWADHPKPNTAFETWDFKTETWVDKRTLPSVQADACDLIRRIMEGTRQASLHNQVPELERETWPRQEAEARAWMTDQTVATPFLDALLRERTLTKEQLCTSVISNADKAWVVLAYIHNLQWQWFDRVKACTTVPEVDALVYSLGDHDFNSEVSTWLSM